MPDPTPTEKRCPRCDETKPLDAFQKDKQKRDGLTSYCKACRKASRHVISHRIFHEDKVDIPTQKRCAKCGETKPINAFYKDKYKKDCHQAHCKVCNAAYCAAYHAANKEHVREYNAAYHAANTKQILKRKAVYNVAHIDAKREYDRAYNTANAERIRKRTAAYAAAHPEVYRAASSRRRARIKGNGGAGFSTEELIAMRAVYSGFCAYCEFPYIAPLQIDHVIPIDQGGPHEAANIVLACPDCNNEKHAKTPEQWTNRWYQRLPRPFSCKR